MIVQRVTFNTKLGKEENAEELLKELFAMHSAPHGRRIYTNRTGPFNELIVETEFENNAEMEAYWAKLVPSWGGNPEFLARWYETVDAGGNNQILNLRD